MKRVIALTGGLMWLAVSFSLALDGAIVYSVLALSVVLLYAFMWGE